MKTEISATYDQDTYKTHRYFIHEQQGIKGTLYILKDIKQIPDQVTIKLKLKGDK